MLRTIVLFYYMTRCVPGITPVLIGHGDSNPENVIFNWSKNAMSLEYYTCPPQKTILYKLIGDKKDKVKLFCSNLQKTQLRPEDISSQNLRKTSNDISLCGVKQ